MQRALGFLVPNFLKRLDRYLLLNHPRWWATKFHYVIFYGILANIFFTLAIFAFIKPNQLLDLVPLLILIIFFPEIGIFIYWLYSQSLFNVEQEYGKTHYTIGIMEVIIYTICVFIIFSPSIIMFITANYKIASYLGINKTSNCTDLDVMLALTSDDNRLQLNHDLQIFRNIEPNDALEKAAIFYQQHQRDLVDLPYEFAREYEYIIDTNNFSSDEIYGRLNSIIYTLNAATRNCYEIRDFTTRFPSEDKNSGFDAIEVWHICFIILGILLLTILKHSNWRIFIFSFLYLLISIILIFIITLIFYSFIPLDFIDFDNYGLDDSSETKVFLASMIIFVLFMIVQSVRSITGKRYRQFPFINFVSLPIAFGFLLFVIEVFRHQSNARDTSSALAIFLLLYLLFSPIQKKMLIHLISLPKE